MSRLLVLAETDGASIAPSTLSAIAFAQQLAAHGGGGFEILVHGGPTIGAAAETLTGLGAERVLVAGSPALAHPTADRVAAVCAAAYHSVAAAAVAGASSTFGRDVLPRLAALLDLPMVTDVIGFSDQAGTLQFRRPMYAGNLIATVRVEGDGAVFSVRTTAYGKPDENQETSAVSDFNVDAVALPPGTEWVSLDAPERNRPELTAARVVVSGGRPLRDAETFERLIGGLADRLGGAVGATRAAVDSGIAANELQVGQTGKVVAPDLYIAAGVSGSVQHLAGMKDSKVIAAINTDPDAPIYQAADYGLVADLHKAIPEMIEKLR